MENLSYERWSLSLFGVLAGACLCLLFDAAVLSRFLVNEDKISAAIYLQHEGGWYTHKPELTSAPYAWGTSIYPVSTDANGFRIDPARSPVRPAQVLFLGDSFTFGINGPWADTFVGIFQRKSGASVVNAGVASYSPTPYLFQYRLALAAGALRKPHAVIVAIDVSDVQDEAAIWRDGERHPQKAREALEAEGRIRRKEPSAVRQFFESHFLGTKLIYRFFRYRLVEWWNRDPNAPPPDAVFDQIRSEFTWRSWSDFENGLPQGPDWYHWLGYRPLGVKGGLDKIRNKLRDIAMLAGANDGEVWLLVYPWPAQLKYKNNVFDWEKFNRDLCAEIRCSGVIDTFPAFRAAPDWYRCYYIPGDVHFNKDGNELIADEVLAALGRSTAHLTGLSSPR